jgi:hypothetical protein
MAEPWENDPDSLIEVGFQLDPAQCERAAAAIEAAVAEINSPHPWHEKRVARAARVWSALPDLHWVETAVSEYFTRESRSDARRKAQNHASVSIDTAHMEAKEVAQKALLFMKRLEAIRAALGGAELTDNGAEVNDSLEMAWGQVVDGWQALNLAAEALKCAGRHMPQETRGRGGALARLRLSPEVALLRKLEVIWRDARLTTRSGAAGDGIDVFLYHAIAAVDRDKVSKGEWLDRLRAKAKRELSSEIKPR